MDARGPGLHGESQAGRRFEECFGRGKAAGLLRKLHVRRIEKVSFLCSLTFTAYDLGRLCNLVGVALSPRDRRTRLPTMPVWQRWAGERFGEGLFRH
jgi:hypothetical protein